MKAPEETQEDVIETAEIVEETKIENGGEIEHPKEGYLFPNIREGLAFGIEATSRQEAEEANKQYLASMKGSK